MNQKPTTNESESLVEELCELQIVEWTNDQPDASCKRPFLIHS